VIVIVSGPVLGVVGVVGLLGPVGVVDPLPLPLPPPEQDPTPLASAAKAIPTRIRRFVPILTPRYVSGCGENIRSSGKRPVNQRLTHS
jgi:hypothetical protein